MLTQTLFYSFSSKIKPEKIVCFGVRFERLELDLDKAFDETKFQLLATANIPAGAADLKALKTTIQTNV